jgi:prenylcysteine oxidase/farnesylcysteine lyase
METETIASRNIVDLLLNEEFNAGICGSRIAASHSENYTIQAAAPNDKNFVIGWDC